MIVELQDAVHGVQHHHVSAESTPAVRRSRPALGVRAVHAQPALDAELRGIPPERLELFAQRRELLLGLRVGGHDRHPAIAEPGRA